MITRDPIDVPYTTNPLLSLWYTVAVGAQDVGRATLLIVQSLAGVRRLFSKRGRPAFVEQLYTVGIASLPLITIVALFIGMILALQTGLELRRFNQEIFIGSAVMVSMLREMGPLMSALILTACVGSAMAAQIGTMTVNDEIAALEMLAIDPVRFLMTPRIWALVIMTPLLSFYTCVVGVIGGGVVGYTQLNIQWVQYFDIAIDFARERDLYVGLLKAVIYGIVIAGVACYEGFTAAQGAVGVGRATRSSVVKSFLLILILGYFVTRGFYNG
ncbi:MAG: ABC transporter permease [Lentisphaerae bacterium]|nr:ABC transporter permease [Lentisphaerota bacterium]